MRNTVIGMAVMVMLSTTALARSPENPTVGYGSTNNTNLNINSASSSAKATAGAKATAIQGQGQAQRQTQANRQNNTNKQNNQQAMTSTYTEEKQAPGFAAPSLTAFGGCKGSVSGGFSVAGFGAALGSTVTDTNCENLNNASWLALQGHSDAALALVCQNNGVREAMALVGKSCPGDKPATTANAGSVSSPAPTALTPVVTASNKPAWCANYVTTSAFCN